jgi:large subunit ribosomal protein L24
MALSRIRKNDTVMVIAGKERGKTGKVLRVLHERDRVLVQSLNMVKRHQKPRGVQSPGGIVEREASIHLSNVQPVCTKCNKVARVTVRRSDGGAVRVCRRCGTELRSAES